MIKIDHEILRLIPTILNLTYIEHDKMSVFPCFEHVSGTVSAVYLIFGLWFFQKAVSEYKQSYGLFFIFLYSGHTLLATIC